MKRGTPEHPKMRALCRLLNIQWPTAVGIMELLWHFTARFAPAGDIGRYKNEEIAAAVGWFDDRPPDELIDALIACRWLDSDDEHRLLVHDWPEHCEDSVHMHLARSGMVFANGTAPKRSRMAKRERTTTAQCAHGVRTESAQCAHEDSTSHSHSRSRSHSQSHSQSHKPEPAAIAGAGAELGARASPSNGQPASLQDWLSAIETALTAAVGRPPRPETAPTLASAAAELGIHPRYVARWIAERSTREGSPPRSDGLFLRIVESDLVPWIKRQHYDLHYLPREQVRCSRCGGVITAFRDLIVPCKCTSGIVSEVA